jgi:hypothetical protein
MLWSLGKCAQKNSALCACGQRKHAGKISRKVRILPLASACLPVTDTHCAATMQQNYMNDQHEQPEPALCN